MSRRDLSAVVRYLRELIHAQRSSGASDAELLERYVRHRDEAAFELLLWRHGALVFNVCRRILPREQDAEDAFQATFLAFVRKAGSISRRSSVAAWLYKVAYRIALAAKARAQKTATHEKISGEVLTAAAEPDPKWAELRPILDEEVNRLPERLRRPFILCYLEGKTNEEAARQLGCPAGTIFSRLARGREMLRRRLQRRGVTLSLAALTAALTEHAAEAMPAATLMTTTVHSALLFAAGQTVRGVSAPAAALAEGVLRAMFVTKLKLTALMVLIAGLFAAGGVFARHALNAAPQPEEPKEKTVVSVIHPTPGGFQRTSAYNGHVRAVAEQHVYPVVSGYLKRIAVDIGDAVKRGDVLAEIDAPLLEVEVKQATSAFEMAQANEDEAKARVVTAEAEVEGGKARLKEAQAVVEKHKADISRWETEVNRLDREVKRNVVEPGVLIESQGQLRIVKAKGKEAEGAAATAEAEIKIKEGKLLQTKAAMKAARAATQTARAGMDKARVQESFTKLKATLDGVVIGRHSNTGEFVSASDQGGRQPLLTVMRTNPIRVAVNVAENDTPFLRPGSSVHLHAAALPDVKLPDCTVSRTGFAIDENTATMPVEIDVPNAKNSLRPGMTIAAAIVLDKKAPAGAVIVPASSVVEISKPNHFGVYVVRDNKAYLTPVRVSYDSNDKMEIESGLRASDRIIVDPRNLKGEVVPVEIK